MAESVAERPVGRVGIARHPFSSLLLPVPVVCFVGGLLTDITYRGSDGNLIWLNFSSWLIAAGLFFGAIGAVLTIVDLVRLPQLRSSWGWGALALLVVVLIVELINSFVHARDGWTAVVPAGLTLSVISAVLVLLYGWLWHESRYRVGDRP
jgi:uncharacterized membrane protein